MTPPRPEGQLAAAIHRVAEDAAAAPRRGSIGERDEAVSIVEAMLQLRDMEALSSSLSEQLFDAKGKSLRPTREWCASMEDRIDAAQRRTADARRTLQGRLTFWQQTYRPERSR